MKREHNPQKFFKKPADPTLSEKGPRMTRRLCAAPVHLGDEVRGNVLGRGWDRVRGSVRDHVWDHVLDRVRDRVRDSVWDSVWERVRVLKEEPE